MSSKRSVASRRTSDQISAATVSSSRRGSGAPNITTLPSASAASRLRGARSSTSRCNVASSVGRGMPAAGSSKRSSKSQSDSSL